MTSTVAGPVVNEAPTGPAATRLPHGFRVVLDRRVRWLDGDAALLGGAPPRLMHLAPAARALLTGGGPLTVEDPTSAALARRLLDAGLAHPTHGTACSPGGPTPADVTVVIPVKDRVPALTRLLAALPSGLGGVIVADDGSADAAALARAAHRVGAQVLRHERSRGPAAARNAGLAAATTDLVAFLDSDVVPQPGWLEPLLSHFVDPAVGLAAPRIVALPPVRGWIGRYEAVRSSLDLGPDPALVVPRSRVAYVPSAAMLVRRAAAGAGFDEAMQVAEDVDLVLRLHAAGWRMRYESAARVAHDHRSAFGAWWLRKAYYGTGAAPLAQRHVGAVPPMVLSPWSAAVCALLLVQRRPATAVAAVIGAVATERLSRKLGRLRRPRVCAAQLTTLGLTGAIAQSASAITRHYWPPALLGCLFSARLRRAVLAAALAEGVWDWWAHRDRDPAARPGAVGYVLAHRLDDLGYGAGLWWGALRDRTIAPLRPDQPSSPPRGRGRTVRQG
ncbi:mycofactocin biosynthesis glycosyltransferase MftF [Pseudonocardia sp. H11422]|uniref:mycofactocin biosynthesis glycosyltransferase MftF n=1 Tax=Pseudonocardia sp. H11422 TaxID=2835866 RepID=UPI001BDCF6C8|nr:mycofactocin biosynthesis glycosyltransferase MftF [Pseudonocardia sp. H11422]